MLNTRKKGVGRFSDCVPVRSCVFRHKTYVCRAAFNIRYITLVTVRHTFCRHRRRKSRGCRIITKNTLRVLFRTGSDVVIISIDEPDFRLFWNTSVCRRCCCCSYYYLPPLLVYIYIIMYITYLLTVVTNARYFWISLIYSARVFCD